MDTSMDLWKLAQALEHRAMELEQRGQDAKELRREAVNAGEKAIEMEKHRT